MDVVSHDTYRLSYDMCHLAHYGTLLQNIIITDYYSTVLLQNISVQSIIKLYKLKSTMKKKSPNITFSLLKNDLKL